MNHLQYLQFSGKSSAPEFQAIYDAAYKFWRAIWVETYRNVSGSGELWSDVWLATDKISVLCYDESPVGLFFHNWYNLNHAAHADLNYFSQYPNEIKYYLNSNSIKNIMTMSYLTVHPDWRRSVRSASISDLLVSLCVRDFMSSQAEILLTHTRNDRKTNELGLRHGGEKFIPDFIYRGIPSSALAFRREGACLSPGLEAQVQELWQNRRSTLPEPEKIAA